MGWTDFYLIADQSGVVLTGCNEVQIQCCMMGLIDYYLIVDRSEVNLSSGKYAGNAVQHSFVYVELKLSNAPFSHVSQ
jgi:hypothetical protein